MDSDHLGFLAQVAIWYYEEGLSQADIAQRVGLSRSMISRLLDEARERELVEIRVRYPLKTDAELERRLCDTFGLAQASVLADPPANQVVTLRCLGELGARCLRQRLHDDILIGISWGTSVYEVVRAMPPQTLSTATVVQLAGSLGSGDPMVDGSEVARWLAQKLNASLRFVHAPLLVDEESVAQALFQDRAIKETLTLASQVEVALLGIGSTDDPQASGLRRGGYLTETDLQLLHDAGAVGDIAACHLDAHGHYLDISLNRRIITLGAEQLRAIPTTIAVAHGSVKAAPILASLRGHFVTVLVTDSVTALSVLALHAEQSGTMP